MATLPDQPLMPVRRLHNYVYCRRLFYLQWVENLWVENSDTAQGAHIHRATDKPSHFAKEADFGEQASVRSLALDAPEIGLTGIIDLLDRGDGGTELIDYKRGAPWRNEAGEKAAKENDAIQVAAYALILKENNVDVSAASVYYAAERCRVNVPLTRELFAKCRSLIIDARAAAASGQCPPPLVDDPRCLHCSAYPVCLPHESAVWAGHKQSANIANEARAPRPQGDEGEVIVVQDPRANVGCRGGELQIRVDGQVVSRHPLAQVQALYLYGGVQVSSQAVQSLLERSVPIAYFSPAGRFLGLTSGLPESGVDARLGQARLLADRNLRLVPARAVVESKIHNQRVLLMRNGSAPDGDLRRLAELRNQCREAANLDRLRGLEGMAAAIYFRHFNTMLKPQKGTAFDFERRNRRPPRDPVNALLSLGYSILAKELAGVCHTVGLDPFIGFYHQPRYGRPALALDLMEEFRPLVVDSTVISLLNRGELDEGDFVHTSRGVYLNDSGRRQFWRAWFRRLDTEVRHSQFGYRMSYRRMLDVQARQYWRFCRGEVAGFHGFITR